MMVTLEQGMTVYTVSMGFIPNLKTAKRLAKLLKSMDGFIGIAPNIPSFDAESFPKTLTFFDSLNHAKGGRNRLRHEGVQCGTHICIAEVDENGVPWIKGAAE